MQWSGWYNLTTTNMIFEIQKLVSLNHFVELEQETPNPSIHSSENVAYFIITDLFQGIV